MVHGIHHQDYFLCFFGRILQNTLYGVLLRAASVVAVISSVLVAGIETYGNNLPYFAILIWKSQIKFDGCDLSRTSTDCIVLQEQIATGTEACWIA